MSLVNVSPTVAPKPFEECLNWRTKWARQRALEKEQLPATITFSEVRLEESATVPSVCASMLPCVAYISHYFGDGSSIGLMAGKEVARFTAHAVYDGKVPVTCRLVDTHDDYTEHTLRLSSIMAILFKGVTSYWVTTAGIFECVDKNFVEFFRHFKM